MKEIVVDSFAGGGGASLGITWALGRSPDIAINHDAEAIAMHAANHPDTLHISKNIWKVDPLDYVKGRRVGLAWFSPDCKHFSKAKGSRPVKRNIRDLAWVVVLWAKRVRPRIICLENVEEFQDWGPVDLEGKPCKERKGETFKKWVGDLRRLGYKVEFKRLRAFRYGTPTIRQRLLMIARCDGLPIVWPEETHGEPDSEGVESGKLKPWRTAAEIIDWSLPCHSIFLTKEEGRELGVKRPLADKTMARIAKGIQRYVIDAAEPFIVTCNHSGESFRGQQLGEPFNTVTAARDAHGLVMPFVSTYYGPKRPGDVRGQVLGEPLKTQTAENRHALVAPFITKFRNGSVGHRLDEPLHTVTASSHVKRPAGSTPLGMAVPFLVPRYGERPGQDPRTHPVDEAMPTIVPTANGGSLVSPFIAGVGGRMGQSAPRPVTKPYQTATSKADSVVVAPIIERQFSGSAGNSADQPLGTVTAGGGGKSALVLPHLMTMRDSQKPHNEADKPTHTVCAGGARLNMVAAFLAQHNTGVVGHDARAPVSSVLQTGSHQAVIASHIINLKGSTRRSSPIDQPSPTQTAGGWHIGEVRAFLMKYYGTGGQWQDCREPIHTVTSKERLGVVTIEGADYQIVDIGMRMLTPRELFRAQGFPDSYVIDPEFNGKPLTKTVQIRCCGNSVPPQWAEAIVRANYIPDHGVRSSVA